MFLNFCVNPVCVYSHYLTMMFSFCFCFSSSDGGAADDDACSSDKVCKILFKQA